MPPPQATPVPRRRWGVGVLLGSGILVSFLDRINLSVAAPQIQHDFHLDAGDLGILLSCFYWPYAALQIPMGLLVDKVGATWMGRVGALLWSVASVFMALAGGFGGILAARVFLGTVESPSFPTVAKATGHWFPRAERARATTIFDAAAKFSNVIGVPLVAFVMLRYGWRWSFGVTSVISLVYFVAYTLLYRDPSADPGLDPAEHAYILEGGGMVEGPSGADSLGMLGYLLRQPKVWGLTLGFGAYGYAFYLFLTWLPDYLVNAGGLAHLKSAVTPWAVATVTDLLVGGWLIDRLITRGADETRVRKAVFVVGMLFGLAIVGATRTTDQHWALFWLSLSLGGLAAAAPVGWSLPSLIAPKGGTGAVSGIMNFGVSLMGIVAPIATGFIFKATHSFTDAFLTAAVVLAGGILAFVFLLGRIEPLPGPEPRGLG